MSEKRKDNKGRILQKGESQRKDGVYQYRYTDNKGKRQCIYAGSLKELRDKVKEVQMISERGGNYAEGSITVSELLRKYIELKENLRVRSRITYLSRINAIEKTSLSRMKIKDVKTSIVKEWVKELYESGVKYGTIDLYKNILSPAFQMAVEEDVIIKNPFNFKLSAVIKNNACKREALSPEEQERLMSFLKEDEVLSKYYDETVVFLETGMRASEVCGLTVDDIKFDKRYIDVNKQFFKDDHGVYYVTELKTNAGLRRIPMSDRLFYSLKNIIDNRYVKNEVVIDGYAKFLFYNTRGMPKTVQNYEWMLKSIIKKFNKDNPGNQLPYITPHVLRHTYCTNLMDLNIDVKTMQYLMGHADVQTTLNIYTHNNHEQAIDRYNKCIEIRKNISV